jgi:hypothetical protein
VDPAFAHGLISVSSPDLPSPRWPATLRRAPSSRTPVSRRLPDRVWANAAGRAADGRADPGRAASRWLPPRADRLVAAGGGELTAVGAQSHAPHRVGEAARVSTVQGGPCQLRIPPGLHRSGELPSSLTSAHRRDPRRAGGNAGRLRLARSSAPSQRPSRKTKWHGVIPQKTPMSNSKRANSIPRLTLDRVTKPLFTHPIRSLRRSELFGFSV